MNDINKISKVAPILVVIPLLITLAFVQAAAIIKIDVLLTLNLAAVAFNLTSIFMSYKHKSYGLQIDGTGVIIALIAIVLSITLM